MGPVRYSREQLQCAHDREKGRRSLAWLVEHGWHIVEPATSFQGNWHIDHICQHLEAVSSGQIRNLVINVPPGSGKSTIVSVFWNAWEWIRNPSEAFLYASFDAGLTLRDAGKLQMLMCSKWFTDRWGRYVKLDPNSAQGEIDTYLGTGAPAGGWRFSTSVAGKTTGRHPGKKVIDDPTKPLEATEENLEKAWKWWTGTMASRARDPATVSTVLIMQRLAENDLAGRLLDDAKVGGMSFEHLRIPAESDGRPYRTCVNTDPRGEVKGISFWTARFTYEVLALKKKDHETWSAQYQQDPTPESGIVFVRTHFDNRYSKLPETGVWTQSWDCTFKGESTSDFVASGVWLYDHPNHYLVDIGNAKMDFVQTIQAIKDTTAQYPQAYGKLIEDKANGTAVMNYLTKQDRMQGIIPYNPGNDSKLSRAKAVVPFFHSANILLPENAPWVAEYINQMVKFPRGTNDDLVDMTSQYLAYMAGMGALDYTAAMANAKSMGLL